MGLGDIGATLPPGFRFYPSDEELVCHYLFKKIANLEVSKATLVEIDLHTCEPWQLPEVAKLNSTEWYFFSFRDRKYATGFRANRATTSGYWKATGKDRMVLDPRTRTIVGMRKTLVFYRNRAPNGFKTGWIMHEFRLENPHLPPKEDWVLCRVFHKAKSENSGDKLSPTGMYDTTVASRAPTSSTFAASPPTDHTCAGGASYHQISTFSHNPTNRSQSSRNLLNLSALDRNYLQLSHQELNDHTYTSNEMVHLKCEDEYGFLLDMSFGDTILRDHKGVASSLEEMQFDDDSTLIFHLNP